MQPPPLPLLASLRTELARPCCLGASPPAQTTSAGVQGRELCDPASDGTATAVRPRRTSGGRQRANDDDEAGSAGDQGRGRARVRRCVCCFVAFACCRCAGFAKTAARRRRTVISSFVAFACCRRARGLRRQQHGGGARISCFVAFACCRCARGPRRQQRGGGALRTGANDETGRRR